MFIDSHCHLDMLAQEEGGIDAVLDEAAANQVEQILSISIDKTSCKNVIALSESHSNVFASVGIHPNADKEEKFTVNELVSIASHPKVIAIGETGLDYFRSEGDLEWQRDRFKTHITAAKELKKPLVIHTREARDDTMNILKQLEAEQAGGIIHCFTENWETAQKALDLDFYISLSGIVTFKNAVELQEVAKRIPLERMLIETDAPYLAPVPKRGKTNKPAYVKHVAEFIADLRGETIEKVAQITSDNFHRLFPSTLQ